MKKNVRNFLSHNNLSIVEMNIINGKTNGYNHKATYTLFQNIKKRKHENWRELESHHKTFQKILQLLVQNEKISKTNKNLCLFYMRQSICHCQPDQIRFYFRDLKNYLFHVVAEISVPGGEMATAWLHEDGIQAERDRQHHDAVNPVHHLFCLQDLYKNYTRVVKLYSSENGPSEGALLLMLDRY